MTYGFKNGQAANQNYLIFVEKTTMTIEAKDKLINEVIKGGLAIIVLCAVVFFQRNDNAIVVAKQDKKIEQLEIMVQSTLIELVKNQSAVIQRNTDHIERFERILAKNKYPD